MADATVTRQQLVDRLNEDLSREYQAIIAYVVAESNLDLEKYVGTSVELEGQLGYSTDPRGNLLRAVNVRPL